MDRFQSVLVEGEAALATMAAYIDLNPVRAGIVEEPMLYEFSGYGDAAGGSKLARSRESVKLRPANSNRIQMNTDPKPTAPSPQRPRSPNRS